MNEELLTETQLLEIAESAIDNSTDTDTMFEFVNGKYITSSTDVDDLDILTSLNESLGMI